MTASSADLLDEEIDRICAGLKQSSAQLRFLKGLGLVVRTKPNGRPLVARANWDIVMGGPWPAQPVREPRLHLEERPTRQRDELVLPKAWRRPKG